MTRALPVSVSVAYVFDIMFLFLDGAIVVVQLPKMFSANFKTRCLQILFVAAFFAFLIIC